MEVDSQTTSEDAETASENTQTTSGSGRSNHINHISNQIKNRAKIDFSKASPEWAILAGQEVNPEAQAARIREDALLSEYERAMGYNPLDWTSPKLDRLRRFLVTKSEADIRTFAAWSRRPYSAFSPAKARSYPQQVVDNWPQAFEPEHHPKGNGRGKVDPVDLAFAELAAERAAMNGNA
jgi:hypothetical protein